MGLFEDVTGINEEGVIWRGGGTNDNMCSGSQGRLMGRKYGQISEIGKEKEEEDRC